MIGKFFVRLFVGLLLASVLSGGQLLQVIVLAVVCTAGIGLIVVVPACYLIGLLATIWFIPFGKGPWSYAAKRALKESTEASMRVPIEEKPLVPVAQYIKRASAKGLSEEQIRAELQRNLWSQGQIDAAWKIAGLSPVKGIAQ